MGRVKRHVDGAGNYFQQPLLVAHLSGASESASKTGLRTADSWTDLRGGFDGAASF